MWVNLPAELKSIAPDYQQVNAQDIDIIEIPGGIVRVLAGGDAVLKLHTRVNYQDVELLAGFEYDLDIDVGMRGFVYVLSGEVSVLGNTVTQAESCFIEKSGKLEITALTETRFMLCFGVPHNQPINQHGSYVD